MRLLIVQYGGDYREAFQRLSKNGTETYHSQKYVINSIVEISQQIEEATLLCCQTKESYNEVLQDGLRAIGAGLDPYKHKREILKLIEEQNPTHLLIHAPIPGIFNWAIQNKVRTIGLLADSFLTTSFRQKFKNYLLARLLNNKQIEWIGNHGINACLSLQEIGVNPEKIIPYDWVHAITPEYYSPKKFRQNVNTWNLVYVGAVAEVKGVGDVIEAVAKLKTRNISVNLQVVGGGEIDYYTQRVRQLNIEDCVKFLGLMGNQTVMNLMREADIVVVPSRHEYPEACPFTIYEAFCVHTPIVASNHPVFKGNLQDGINAMIFPAGDSTALAASVEKLISNPEIYERLSEASSKSWEQLQIPVKWAEFINCWLHNSSNNQDWLFKHRLTSGMYNSWFSRDNQGYYSKPI
ncbi:glycosyltransferase family 4 protein [Brasilonema bromeliae]|uniref:Glycosyl transferase family 1 n=1 Tax=Brasilonema bromeliae SPC951 TaxID=385972 RepID=A0ABX1PAE6_9CYAN|nr:glycosyltransferase family 4 protein [Brasilonema bromeliae]NMG21405.1 glycosyl transferase family 1 [Brasilonema bromeliae SPC951]